MGYPTIKLTRFDNHGRSTAIWLALHLADIPFDDEDLAFEEWESFRARAPFAQSPIMTVNGTVYAQVPALLRFVGSIAGLFPANPILGMAVDEIVAAVEAFYTGFEQIGAWVSLESAERQRIVQAACQDTFRKLLETLNHLTGQQTKGFAVGDQLTIADLALYGLMHSIKRGLLEPFPSDGLDRFDNLQDLYKNVSKQPKVIEYSALLK